MSEADSSSKIINNLTWTLEDPRSLRPNTRYLLQAVLVKDFKNHKLDTRKTFFYDIHINSCLIISYI